MGHVPGRKGAETTHASTETHVEHREPSPMPLPVSGLLRGAFTGVMTAIAIACGLAIYAMAERARRRC
jgi:hypothetical protein